MSEFNVPIGESATEEKNHFQWLYTNGLLAVIFSIGVLITSLKSTQARSWKYGTGMESFLCGSLYFNVVHIITFVLFEQACLGVLLQTMGFP